MMSQLIINPNKININKVVIIIFIIVEVVKRVDEVGKGVEKIMKCSRVFLTDFNVPPDASKCGQDLKCSNENA